MNFSIAGKTAIITGAAAGIGHAIARHFLEQGANVVLADQSDKRLKAAAEDLVELETARMFCGDLRERLTVANLLSATLDAFERVDILVNAARAFMVTDPLDPADDTVEAALNQNMMLSLRLSQAVARRMIAQAEASDTRPAEAGCIVNLSSVAAQRTQPQLLAYSISTAATEQMTRSLAVALAPHGIRVNAIAMGSVMSASLRDQMTAHPDYREAILRGTPLHRIANPTEVALMAQYLASGAAGFVTGQVIACDGGRSALDVVQRPAH